MQKPRGAPAGPRPADNAARRHPDALLDESLEESFPASDPPAMTDPHDHETPSGDER